jgi:hypothetical protein
VARLLRPKALIAVAAVVVGAALAAAVARGLFLRDSARPASVTAALRLFREGNPSPTGNEGVYLYDTTGSESLDVLGGVTHRYPAATTIALTRTSCGARLRWQPLTERSTTWVLCLTPRGIVERSSDEVHDFFGKVDRTSYHCTNSRGTFTCVSPHGRELGVAVDLGRETIAVGDTRIGAVHIRTTAQISGGDRGTETVDWWLAPNSAAPSGAAPVRISFSSRTSRKEPIIGAAHYREHAALRLASLEPLR